MVQHSFMAGRQRRMWSRHLQQGFNSRPPFLHKGNQADSSTIALFRALPSACASLLTFSSPTRLLFNKHLGRTIHMWCIEPQPTWRSREGALAMIKDSELVGKKVRNCEDLETLPHASDTLPSLNMHRSYLLVSTALCFWQRRLRCSLNLRVRQ